MGRGLGVIQLVVGVYKPRRCHRSPSQQDHVHQLLSVNGIADRLADLFHIERSPALIQKQQRGGKTRSLQYRQRVIAAELIHHFCRNFSSHSVYLMCFQSSHSRISIQNHGHNQLFCHGRPAKVLLVRLQVIVLLRFHIHHFIGPGTDGQRRIGRDLVVGQARIDMLGHNGHVSEQDVHNLFAARLFKHKFHRIGIRGVNGLNGLRGSSKVYAVYHIGRQFIGKLHIFRSKLLPVMPLHIIPQMKGVDGIILAHLIGGRQAGLQNTVGIHLIQIVIHQSVQLPRFGGASGKRRQRPLIRANCHGKLIDLPAIGRLGSAWKQGERKGEAQKHRDCKNPFHFITSYSYLALQQLVKCPCDTSYISEQSAVSQRPGSYSTHLALNGQPCIFS